MLKKVKDVSRHLAEQTGLMAPSVPDAGQAADVRRQQLVEAQRAVQQSEEALDAAYDRGATPREIQECEAKLADARLNGQRAQSAYQSAERRLASAKAIDADKVKSDAIVKRDAALEVRAKAAARMDALAAEMAAVVAEYDGTADALAEAARHGVAARVFGIVSGAVLVEHALQKTGAKRSTWIGGRAEQPGAVELAEKQRGAILAVITNT